jgi:2-keto-4-pentenoate hydratase/2-oxohepta-3-ene-1,7-dioic acid hydratase in catechol pathway
LNGTAEPAFVNGDTVQDESTSAMLFDVPELIAHLSTVAEARPGDIIPAGTRADNGVSRAIFVLSADVTEGTTTVLGTQRNRFVA